MENILKLQNAYRSIEDLLSNKEYVANIEYTVKYYGCSDKQWNKSKIKIVAKHAMREILGISK